MRVLEQDTTSLPALLETINKTSVTSSFLFLCPNDNRMTFATLCCCRLMGEDAHLLSKPDSQPWPRVALFISHHPRLLRRCTQCNKYNNNEKEKNARKFIIRLSCHEEWKSQVARGHIHSLSPSTPEEELDRGLPSASPCHLEQIQMIKWQALPCEDALFPRKPRRFLSHPIF